MRGACDSKATRLELGVTIARFARAGKRLVTLSDRGRSEDLQRLPYVFAAARRGREVPRNRGLFSPFPGTRQAASSVFSMIRKVAGLYGSISIISLPPQFFIVSKKLRKTLAIFVIASSFSISAATL